MQLTSTKDQLFFPQKIISLVPSQTELLHYLGLENEVIGITKFCVHPEKWFRAKTRIGGTKTVNIGLIKKLQPDLIIANKEENIKEQVEILAKDFAVWVTNVNNLEEAFNMISDIGELTNTVNKAQQLIVNIKEEFSKLPIAINPIRACYLIWQKPYMTVGNDTFIHNMMQLCGLQNIFKDKIRYPEITLEEIKNGKCQLLILSSEPYPFKNKHILEIQQHLPETKIVLANGEMFSWYGSRVSLAAKYFNENISKILLA